METTWLRSWQILISKRERFVGTLGVLGGGVLGYTWLLDKGQQVNTWVATGVKNRVR